VGWLDLGDEGEGGGEEGEEGGSELHLCVEETETGGFNLREWLENVGLEVILLKRGIVMMRFYGC